MILDEPSIRIHFKTLFDGAQYKHDVVLTIVNGLITAIDNEISSSDIILDGLTVPGFVDLQVNGGDGVLFNADPSLSTIKRMLSAHSQFGTIGMLPTIITDDVNTMKHAADAVSLAIREKVPGILGIHFEGPHISETKKGAHSHQFIRPISEAEWQIFERKDLGHILITLAPEAVSLQDIERFVSLGVIVSIGHTNATFDEADLAFDAGAKIVTHIFNAMSQINGREAGVVGAALLNDQVQCGLILDGHHVSLSSCKLALKTKPPGGIFLVTDAMPPVGTNQTEFNFFDRKVTYEDGKLTSSTGELAGSVLNMITAVRNCHTLLDISLNEAFRMASLYPLKVLEKANLPIPIEALLVPNKDASFVQLDQNFKVDSTWIKGQCVYRKQAFEIANKEQVTIS
jgi:N-acetylglucosamine-6-phosphate deacetylase